VKQNVNSIQLIKDPCQAVKDYVLIHNIMVE